MAGTNAASTSNPRPKERSLTHKNQEVEIFPMKKSEGVGKGGNKGEGLLKGSFRVCTSLNKS